MKKNHKKIITVIFLGMILIPVPTIVVESLLALEIIFSLVILIWKIINKKNTVYPKLIICFCVISLVVCADLSKMLLLNGVDDSQTSILLYLATNIFSKNYIASFIIAILLLSCIDFLIQKAGRKILRYIEEKSQNSDKGKSDFNIEYTYAIKYLKGTANVISFMSLVNVFGILAKGISRKPMSLQSAITTYFPIISLNIIAFSIPLFVVGISLLMKKTTYGIK